MHTKYVVLALSSPNDMFGEYWDPFQLKVVIQSRFFVE